MEQNLSFWKKLLILISFNLLVFSTLQASRIENMPATLKQPDGSQIACLLSGDEYYNWVSDTNGYTLLKNAQGWIVYAALADGALVPTEYLAYSIDPRTVGLVPYLNISAEKRTQIRANFINQTAAAAQLRHPAQAAPQNAPASNTYRTGTLNNIVIYISFPDADFTTTHNQILPNFNGTIRGSSMQQYYKDISNNNFHINSTFFPAQSGTTVLSYQAPHNRSYYEIDNDEPTGRIIEHTLLHDAVVSMQSAIEAAFTGVQLDYNNDGNVDNIIFVVQGNTGGWSTLLWPHRWVLYTYQPYYDNELYLNGKMVWDYNLVLENHVGVSTLVHETYHTLGAPDLYRYQGDFDPVGSWDIMASNATPPQSSSAHISHKYGEFLIDNDIQEITASGTYTLYDIWDRTPGHKKAYKLATSNPDEWIYLEYRKKTSEVYESNIPGEGIVIYRVKTSLNGNSNGPPDEVYIYRPNASDNSTDGSLSTAFFSSQSGRTFFSSTSNPPCFLTDGSLCNNFTISTISASGSSTMTFNVSFTSGSNGCTTATYGQWPLDIFTPNCTGSIETISSDCYASEYSVVSVTGGATYTFSSSVSSDFITLTNWTGTTIYEIGTGSLTVNANVSTTVRFYTHTNSNCGAENLPRSRNVTCNTSSNPPANDNCSNAINLTCGVVTTGTLTGATPTANVSYSQSSKNDVFYYFTATNSGDYTISLSNFFGDFDLFLHPDCNSATFLESSTQTSSTETITYNCAANTTYRIRITDYQSTGGSFNLLLTCPTITVPSNDQCANYTTLSCGSTLNGTTVGATAKSVTDNTASPYGVWYSFLGDGQQTTISSSANYDHELVLFSGSCNSLSYITNNDDNNTYDSPNGYGSALTFNTVSGTRYYVYVAYYSSTGNETQTGVFNISRTCTAQTYSITATADTNGSISPSGSVSVTGGNSQIFTITPNSGYQISQVLVDGSNVGAVSSYPFSNVTANHTISASFSPLQYTITASADEHSNIYPSGEVIVDFGNNQEFTFTFNEGYELEAVLIDGTYTNFYANSWMFSNVISDCSIHVISKAVSDGIEDVLAKQLFIFPNPVKKELFIKTDLAIEKIEIYSLTGSLLLSEDNFTGKISMQNLAQGVYLLKAYTDKGLAVSKIVKER